MSPLLTACCLPRSADCLLPSAYCSLREPVPENAAAQYAVASALARCASDTNFDRICLYLNRLPTEFRVLCVRDATLRQPAIRSTAGYTKWAVENHYAIA